MEKAALPLVQRELTLQTYCSLASVTVTPITYPMGNHHERSNCMFH